MDGWVDYGWVMDGGMMNGSWMGGWVGRLWVGHGWMDEWMDGQIIREWGGGGGGTAKIKSCGIHHYETI